MSHDLISSGLRMSIEKERGLQNIKNKGCELASRAHDLEKGEYEVG